MNREERGRAGVTALGAYAPERILSNSDLEAMMDTSDEWIVSRTGIKRRHLVAEDEFTSHLAVKSVEDLVCRHGPESLEGVDIGDCRHEHARRAFSVYGGVGSGAFRLGGRGL